MSALWTALHARATPALMLNLPKTASVLEIGRRGAGAALTLLDLVATARVFDESAPRVRELNLLVRERDLARARVEVGRARVVLAAHEPVDVLLLLDGFLGTRADDLARALKPSGELALVVKGLPGHAQRARQKLAEAGFRQTELIVPWPSGRAPFAWTAGDSTLAWSTMIERWRPAGRSRVAAAIARAARAIDVAAPGFLRSVAVRALPAVCILARR